ncbi:LysE family transporter [Defluviitalea raffinosedens]|uniref:LysE family transporter n=1 Tax=Defluviitalea raffinosedens TaxID=1450156 RepID=A0A7C8HIC2_9FIRM|nr:LysE family transporter [Defluviitalea raffinosedens]KAE9634844.1 LysE family transporter [Defluviitalea raffinosedens]
MCDCPNGLGGLRGISAVLNTTLVAVIPKILVVMQIIGSVYMLYLAYQIYKMEVSEQAMIQTGTFASGILMQFVNPKVVLFTMTVIPSFVIPYYREPMKLALFVSVITLIGFLAFITWVLFGSVFKKFLQKHQKIVNIVMALFLVYSAFMVSGAVELIKR